MFVVSVTYTASPDKIDPLRPEHGVWLKDLIARGRLLAAGRQVPLVGGVYLVPDMPVEELDELLATDPYLLHDVAVHSVAEFTLLLAADGLEGLLGQTVP